MSLPRKVAGLREILQMYKMFFFDLDGVLWKGEQTVEGALEAMALLRKHGKRVCFITNSSLRGREALLAKFYKHGFEANLEQCYSSPYFSALYLKEKHPHIKNIMVFGSAEMAREFTLHGFEVNHVVELPAVSQPIELAHKHLDLTAQAIVVGWDVAMSHLKLIYISMHVQHGIPVFGTNPDKFTMIENYLIPGAGAILAAIEAGCNTKVQVIGKPNTFVIEHLIQKENLDRKGCIMIGDNRETDIAFGLNAGIDTLCVLTGVTKEEELLDQAKLKAQPVPTYYSANLWE